MAGAESVTHVAAAPKNSEQRCARCGLLLARPAFADVAPDDSPTFYPYRDGDRVVRFAGGGQALFIGRHELPPLCEEN